MSYKKSACPQCKSLGKDLSEDNLVTWDNGSSKCMSCGYKPRQSGFITEFKYYDIKSRGISKKTCEFYGYGIAPRYTGALSKNVMLNKEPVHVISFYKEDKIVRQKLRAPKQEKSKQFGNKGDATCNKLFGQDQFSPSEKVFVTITEGELDALSIAEVSNCQYPVVSVTNGAGGAFKQLKENLQYLLGFKYVVLAFDSDDAGMEAMYQCASLFEHDKVKIVKWPVKDANDMLLKGRKGEIIKCLWNAQPYRPQYLVTASDIMDRILVKPEIGIPYPWESLNQITYGFKTKEIIVIAAANGIGKTEFVTQLIFHLIEHGIYIGLFSFEQSPEDTFRRLAGWKLKKKLHLPGCDGWNEEEIRNEVMKLDAKMYCFDNPGGTDDGFLINNIRFLSKNFGMKLFIIDNIKGLSSYGDTTALTTFMKTLQKLRLELDCTIILLSHVSKDKMGKNVYVSTSPKHKDSYLSQSAEDLQQYVNKPGLSWETGRMPGKENVEGASSVTDLADTVLCLARDTLNDDDTVKRTMIVKAVKTRTEGMKAGNIFKLYYQDDGTYLDITDL